MANYSDFVERLDIHENVVSTDYIEHTQDGFYFKGHGKSPWKITYYTYLNEWCDKEHTFYAKTLDGLLKHYPQDRLNDNIDDELTVKDLLEIYEWGL